MSKQSDDHALHDDEDDDREEEQDDDDSSSSTDDSSIAEAASTLLMELERLRVEQERLAQQNSQLMIQMEHFIQAMQSGGTGTTPPTPNATIQSQSPPPP